jgi:hypothetical protein
MSEQERKKPLGSHERRGIEAEMEVPVNLERVLLEAGQDPACHQALVTDRPRALAEKGFVLRASEQAMLSAMPRDALDKMVERLKPDKLKKSTFAKHVVTALAGSLIITTSACDSTTKGNGADWPLDGGGGTSADASFDGGRGGAGGVKVNTGGPGGTAGAGAGWPRGGGGGSSGSEGDDSGV